MTVKHLCVSCAKYQDKRCSGNNIFSDCSDYATPNKNSESNMFYRVRMTYQTLRGVSVTSTLNMTHLPQLDTILHHLQDVRPGTLTVYWTEEETV
jgi:hypothetical protein